MRDELDEEMRSHLALRAEYLRERGMSPTDAEAEALRRFGDINEYAEYSEGRTVRRTRRLRIVQWFDEWRQDLRFADVQFRRNLGFTTLAVLTLALGIGANTAIFSVVNRLLIAPLPYTDGNRIVKLVLGGHSDDDFFRASVSAWNARARSLESIAAVRVESFMLQDFGDVQDSTAAFMTTNYLDLLGLRPSLGRAFRKDEELATASGVAMISYGKWQREFGGNSNVLGKPVNVKGRPYTIIGVTPPELSVPMTRGAGATGVLRQPEPAIWLPSSLDSIELDYVFAKLRRGVSADRASAEMQSIVEGLPHPDGQRITARAKRSQDFLEPRETQMVRVLFVAVGVLLLIACANVANLLLSRAWTRRREFSVRIALGAGRFRLVRQVLTESVLLAMIGGALGIGVAWGTLEIILALRPRSLEHLADVSLEPSVLVWSAAISILTGILFGSIPALFAGARNVGDVLRSESRSTAGGTVARRVRSALIVLEIAMSLVLLIGAGLLVRSFAELRRMPLGFDPHGLVDVDVMLMFKRDMTPEYRAARRSEVLERIRAIPGVTEASFGMMPGQGWRELNKDGSSIGTVFISPGYFKVARLPLVAGRLPDSATWPRGGADDSLLSAEVVVSQRFARRYWPNGGALGSRIPDTGRERLTVVGIANDVEMPGGKSFGGPEVIYRPLPWRLSDALVIVRTTLSAAEITSAIRRTVAEFGLTMKADAGTPWGALVRSSTVGDIYLRDSLAPSRFAMALFVAFAGVALVLSSVGLYGVIAYSVMQRTREIGVRVALGADAGSVTRLVVGAGLKLTAFGVAAGLVAAAASTRVLRSLLYGVTPADPLSFAGVAVLVVAIAALAAYVPARRALRINPTEALRAD